MLSTAVIAAVAAAKREFKREKVVHIVVAVAFFHLAILSCFKLKHHGIELECMQVAMEAVAAFTDCYNIE